MASPPTSEATSAPWEAKRKPTATGRLRRIITWSLGLGVVALLVYGMMPRPIEVEIGTITMNDLTVHIVEEGKTRIRNRYLVAAPVTGTMRRVALKAGDTVQAGETILTTIEPTLAPLLDARSKAQAEARVAASEAALLRAKESLQMAQTSAQFATATWDRIRNSSQKGSVSINEREAAERDADMRQREVRATEFAQKITEYELAVAKAALLQMDSPQADALIPLKAPVSGRVLKVMQESAQVISAGTPIIEIGDPADLEIEAEILSRDAVVIQPGAEVQIEQWGGEKPLQGRVRRIEPAAFTKVSALGVEEQRVIVLSDLVNPPAAAQALGDRYRVEVRVAIWSGKARLLIPAGALFREGSEWMTFVVKDHKAHKTKLTTGPSNGRFTEVLSGVQLGQEVLLHPPDSVTDGVAVTSRKN
jgi:HlyD family secretion protein